MLARATSILLAASAGLAWATPYQLKEFHPIPRGWSQLGRAPRSHSIHLEIGLKQSRFDELEKNLYEGTRVEVNTSFSTLPPPLHVLFSVFFCIFFFFF